MNQQPHETPTARANFFAQDHGDVLASEIPIASISRDSLMGDSISGNLISTRDTEEYADDLARELLNDSNELVRSGRSANVGGGAEVTAISQQQGERIGPKSEEEEEEEEARDQTPRGWMASDTSDQGRNPIEGTDCDRVRQVNAYDNEDQTNLSAALTIEDLNTHSPQWDKQHQCERAEEEQVLQDTDKTKQELSGNTTTSSQPNYRADLISPANEELSNKSCSIADNNTQQDPDNSVSNYPITSSSSAAVTSIYQSFQVDSGNDSSRLDQEEENLELDNKNTNCESPGGKIVQVTKDSTEKMEFDKFYSDDLMSGGGGEKQPPTTADLADFELPPYSGSSSSSEAKQNSPVRKLSPSTSIEKNLASSSSYHYQQQQQQQQTIDASSPNFSALKYLLMSSYSKVSHVFQWKKPIESGIYFMFGITLITALTFYSIISVVAYYSLAIVLASGLIRIYKTLMKTLNRPSDTPFDHIWDEVRGLNVTFSPERVHELVDSSLSNVNASLVYFKQVLLIEDKFATFKFATCLYLLTYIGSWFNGMTLITLSYLGLFSAPILYEKNKTKIDTYINMATDKMSSAVSMVTNKVSSITSGSDGKKKN